MAERKPKCHFCVDFMLDMASSLGGLRKSIETENWKNAEWYGKLSYEGYKSIIIERCIAEEDREDLSELFPKLKMALDREDREKADDYARLIEIALKRSQMKMFIKELCRV